MHQDPGSWLNYFFQFKIGFLEAIKQGSFGTFFHFDLVRTLNPALWTMPIELVGSFFVFAVLALTSALPRKAIIYTALAFVLYETNKPYMMDFLVGIILCDIFTTLSKSARWPRLPIFPAVAVVAAGLALGGLRTQFVLAHFHVHSLFSEYWPTAAALMIVGGVLLSPFLQRALERNVFAFLGRISFPLYLIHSPVICFVGCLTYVHLRARLQSHAATAWAASLLCVAVSIFGAWVLYYAADLPAIRFGRIVEQKIFRLKGKP
jgi:peptidoglycan/LPS O-acetylase OafA/YrhL